MEVLSLALFITKNMRCFQGKMHCKTLKSRRAIICLRKRTATSCRNKLGGFIQKVANGVSVY